MSDRIDRIVQSSREPDDRVKEELPIDLRVSQSETDSIKLLLTAILRQLKIIEQVLRGRP